MQDQILDMLLKEDEITWQSIIHDLVRTEQMDPWDIDLSLLSQKYLAIIQRLDELNFFISGKVILAASILLKIKSDKLLVENIASFDSQLFNQDSLDLDEELEQRDEIKLTESPKLTIKTPLARKRKVTLNDLLSALEKALKVDKRRTVRKLSEIRAREEIQIPEKKIDITKKIKELYQKISSFFSTKKEILTFSLLIPSNRKEDKISTFIPLLHLATQEKINLTQKEHFGEIIIELEK